MMIALLLALAQAPVSSIDGLPIGGLAQQALPERGCAAYLFSTGPTRVLAAMVGVDPATLRIAIDGRTADYPRVTANGSGPFGFASEASYRTGDISVTLALTIEQRANLTAGAVVPAASVTVDRPGKDTIVVPMAGLIGCRT